jgi:hypothetical protein
MTCPFEHDLLDALGRGYVNPALTAHAGECERCRELRLVAGALLEDGREAIADAAVPSSAAMWWRMQVRQRQEAQSAARRTLLVGQAATLLIAAALLVSLFGVEITSGVREMIAAIRVSTPLLIALSAWLVAAPVAGWVAMRQK